MQGFPLTALKTRSQLRFLPAGQIQPNRGDSRSWDQALWQVLLQNESIWLHYCTIHRNSRSSSCHILWPSPPQSSKTSLSIVPMVVQYTALQLHHCTTIGTQYAAVRKSTKVTTIQEEPRRRINKAFAYSSSLLESSLQNKLFAQQFKSWLGWWGAPKLVASKFPRFQIINLGFRISCAAK